MLTQYTLRHTSRHSERQLERVLMHLMGFRSLGLRPQKAGQWQGVVRVASLPDNVYVCLVFDTFSFSRKQLLLSVSLCTTVCLIRTFLLLYALIHTHTHTHYRYMVDIATVIAKQKDIQSADIPERKIGSCLLNYLLHRVLQQYVVSIILCKIFSDSSFPNTRFCLVCWASDSII